MYMTILAHAGVLLSIAKLKHMRPKGSISRLQVRNKVNTVAGGALQVHLIKSILTYHDYILAISQSLQEREMEKKFQAHKKNCAICSLIKSAAAC